MNPNVTFALVYQTGIANVFKITEVSPTENVRQLILQSDFHTAETLVRGAKMAGAKTAVFACNMAGDITNQNWTCNLDSQPFSKEFRCSDLDNIRK